MIFDSEGNPVDYRFIEVNTAFEECTGLSAETIRGRTEENQFERFVDSPWVQSAPVSVDNRTVGAMTFSYSEERPAADIGPFLREEQDLLEAIAGRERSSSTTSGRNS